MPARMTWLAAVRSTQLRGRWRGVEYVYASPPPRDMQKSEDAQETGGPAFKTFDSDEEEPDHMNAAGPL